MATIILQSKERAKTRRIMSLLEELRIKARRINDEELEDAYLAKLVDKGMAVPLEVIRKKLRR